jgi:hypothetical protein
VLVALLDVGMEDVVHLGAAPLVKPDLAKNVHIIYAVLDDINEVP